MATPKTPLEKQFHREIAELVGAIGLYLGEVGSAHEGDKERLKRAMIRAVRNTPQPE